MLNSIESEIERIIYESVDGNILGLQQRHDEEVFEDNGRHA